MRMGNWLLSAAALMVIVVAPAAKAEEELSQPVMAHAHYGRDGFWHCDEDYLPAENTGVCTPASEVFDRTSVYGRLRQFELSEAARPGTVSRR